jgi:hypothetical protein
MNLGSLFGKIMGFLVIIITLALAPSIVTANTAVATHDNVTAMLGMGVVSGFGAPLIILGLLTIGGIFALAGVKGQLASAGMKDLFSVIGSVIVVIVLLTLMPNVMDYTADLIEASEGFAVTIYSIIPLLIYLGIVAGAGWTSVHTYRKARKGGKKSRAAVANY